MRVLIIGCGYVGLALGKELVRQGHEVWGLRRTADSGSGLAAAGIKPLTADITRPETLLPVRANYDWVVNCVSAAPGGAEAYRQTYLQGTRNLLDWLAPSPPQKLVYTSSTSVYGQDNGSVVDERSPTEPTTETGRILVETEQLLLAAVRQSRFPAIILRVAGIYGPGRGYWLKQFLSGDAVMEGNGERYLNMIHRDDVAEVVTAALERAEAGAVYNAVDDEPTTQLAMFEWLARRLKRPLPTRSAVAGERKRGATSKRVSNAKLKRELGYQFRYPTFREGFAAELE